MSRRHRACFLCGWCWCECPSLPRYEPVLFLRIVFCFVKETLASTTYAYRNASASSVVFFLRDIRLFKAFVDHFVCYHEVISLIKFKQCSLGGTISQNLKFLMLEYNSCFGFFTSVSIVKIAIFRLDSSFLFLSIWMIDRRRIADYTSLSSLDHCSHPSICCANVSLGSSSYVLFNIAISSLDHGNLGDVHSLRPLWRSKPVLLSVVQIADILWRSSQSSEAVSLLKMH